MKKKPTGVGGKYTPPPSTKLGLTKEAIFINKRFHNTRGLVKASKYGAK